MAHVKKVQKLSASSAKIKLLDVKMRERGFVHAQRIADQLGLHVGSVYRWVREDSVESKKVLGRQYIHLESAIKLVGAEAAQIFGLDKLAKVGS